MAKVFSVYFNGTDDSNKIPEYFDDITLAALLDAVTVKDDQNNFSVCINGCGLETTDRRDLGVIFTFHLEKQVLRVAKQVEQLVESSDTQVVLNIYGFSRGGAAAFLLGQKLKYLSIERLKINIASFEPVPGNFIMSVYGDVFLGLNNTLSAAVADLTACHNLANLLVLLTNKSMPDIVCHAPILPAYPKTCQADIDVTPGCHKSAVTFTKVGETIRPKNDESSVVFHRIVDFMQKCGTKFDFSIFKFDNNLVRATGVSNDMLANNRLLDLYQNLAKMCSYTSQKRSMHLSNTIFTSLPDANKYLNRYHQQLSKVEAIEQLVFVLAIFSILYQRYGNNNDNNYHASPSL